MAKGRPDWTSSINITGQDLAEVISRPKYGGAQTATYSGPIAVGSDDNIISITGTGMIYGGYLRLLGYFNTDAILNRIWIDGSYMGNKSIERLNIWWIENESMWYIYEKYYKPTIGLFMHGVSRGITFETSYVLNIQNPLGSGDTVGVTAEVIYALI